MPAGPSELAQYAAKIPPPGLPDELSQYAVKPQPQSPPDQFAQDRAVTEAWAQNHKILGPIARFLVAGGQNAANAITDTPSALYHAITDPPTLEEAGLPPEQRVIYRLGGKQAMEAGQSYARGEVTPRGAASVLPEALGTGVGQVAGGAVYGKGGEIAGDVASAAAASPRARAVVTAPVRYGARAAEAAANSKLKPFMRVMTPADEAAAQAVKIPGRDFGLQKPSPPPTAPVAASTPGTAPAVAENATANVPAKVGPPTLGDLLKPADVQAAANKAVGYEPPKPGVPIGQQGLPPGHTPVESSAVRSYKYDADARTLEVQPTSGTTTYRYGDVSPEQGADFQNAKSVGKAWQSVRESGSPLVAKRVNGKWVPVKPTQAAQAPATASLGDLTSQGQASVNNVIDSKVMQVLGKGQPGLTVSLEQLAKDPALSRFTADQLQASAVRLRNAGKVWGHTARAAGEAAESIYGIASR